MGTVERGELGAGARGDSAKIFSGYSTIELANTQGSQHSGLHESRVDAYAVQMLIDRSPMSEATAHLTPVKLDGAVTPHVDVGRAGGRNDSHLFR